MRKFQLFLEVFFMLIPSERERKREQAYIIIFGLVSLFLMAYQPLGYLRPKPPSRRTVVLLYNPYLGV